MIANPAYNDVMSVKQKAQLRHEMLAWRKRLGAEQAGKLSQDIINHAMPLMPWPDIRSLHIYVPQAQNREVDTWPLMEYVWRNVADCTVAVPVLNDGRMAARTATPDTQWHTGHFGIPEPANGELLTDNHQYDVIIVPTLGFTGEGYRLGYGGGYYDKFLATQKQALTIGLCYEAGLVSFEPEAHDVPLDYVVTEVRVISKHS